ncbi:hypothetical protein R1flu_012878 [Riccia fluitans]|uniref:Uncharacterized protein n=1 Tax=Riccia fluitans TaxID=41844 RepID=A0ABD1ZBW6_9MARC
MRRLSSHRTSIAQTPNELKPAEASFMSSRLSLLSRSVSKYPHNPPLSFRIHESIASPSLPDGPSRKAPILSETTEFPDSSHLTVADLNDPLDHAKFEYESKYWESDKFAGICVGSSTQRD